MNTITEEDLLKTDPALKNRPYQIEALLGIFLYIKCLVKMFCGTGKSLIITNTIIHAKKNLSVIVFPSLALIQQYSADYLNNEEYKKHFKKHKKMNVSSESLTNIKSTTDHEEIKQFIKGKDPKIILVTYQSLDVLISCLDGQKIGIVCYDEAHHVTSPKYQTLVFGTDYFEKEVFFTATPVNANGITMYDRDDPEKNMCGQVAYEYTYLQGLVDGFLNAFEVCVDMYTENTNASIYEAMARAILTKGTSRVLSFHSGVEGESNTDVKKFVDIKKFKTAFEKVQETEFPEKANYYTKITFKGMDGKMPPSERKKLLKALDATPDNEIYIISSCETMGEGVDTKKANMCVFADPKSSITKIIQNIGRVLRRNEDCPTSTILIPCWIDKEKYEATSGDKIKQDEIIRQQMRAGDKGDFACILNVLAALKQEDPELYDACLNYPTKAHKEASLNEQGFHIADEEDEDSDASDAVVYDEEEVQQMKDDGEIPLEIHTNETIERFNEEVKEEPLMRLYHDEEEGVYKEIIPNEEDEEDENEDERRVITPPPKRKVSMNFNMSSDVEMLWSITPSDLDKNIRSAIIQCEVIKVDQMEIAVGIVERAKAREAEGNNLLPRHIKTNNMEYKDASILQQWKQFLKGNKTTHKLQDNVKIYLDKSLIEWSDEIDDKQMKRVKEIVSRAKGRMAKFETLFPVLPALIENPINEEQKQEREDAMKINTWKKSLKGEGKKRLSILTYLDKELPGWNNSLEEKALDKAKAIVSRANARVQLQSNFIPIAISNPKTEIENQEVYDAKILGMWKLSLKGKGTCNLYKSVKKYLDENLKGWCEEYTALNHAKEIVERAIKRNRAGGHLLPKDYHISKSKEARKTKDLDILKKIEESQDAAKLVKWAIYIINGGSSGDVCPDDVRKYLDKELPGWNSTLDDDAMKHVIELVKRAKIRKSNGGKLLPTRHDKKKPKKTLDENGNEVTEPDNRTDNEKQEDKDSKRLKNLSNALSRTSKGRCSNDICVYLDKELPGWREPKKRTKKQSAIPLSALQATGAPTTTHNFPPISEIGKLHKTYLRMGSDTLNKTFKADPQLWVDYHATRKRNFATYEAESIPSNRIIMELEKIQTKRQKVVVDMGCGEAPIAHHFSVKNDPRFAFHNYDHQSGGDPLIQEVDISELPLEDASTEIVIMSLALWGTQDNCIQYIKEAYRVLESGGKFYISDSTKKWSPEPLTKENAGELLRTLLTENGFKIISEDTTKIPFCLFVCTKIY